MNNSPEERRKELLGDWKAEEEPKMHELALWPHVESGFLPDGSERCYSTRFILAGSIEWSFHIPNAVSTDLVVVNEVFLQLIEIVKAGEVNSSTCTVTLEIQEKKWIADLCKRGSDIIIRRSQ